jgi:DeoR family transcriptional regulator, deoxyribose operon repressor
MSQKSGALGMLAAALIKPGDTAFFDCGTTVPFMIDFIPEDLEFTGVCNSLNVLLRLSAKPKCNLVVCGGSFHRKNQVFENRAELSILNGVRLAWAFISAGGVSEKLGVTCFNLNEVEVKKQVLRQAKKSVLLADHSKFGAVRTAHFAALKDFDFVVSDKKLSRLAREAIGASGAELIV